MVYCLLCFRLTTSCLWGRRVCLLQRSLYDYPEPSRVTQLEGLHMVPDPSIDMSGILFVVRDTNTLRCSEPDTSRAR